MTFYKVCKFFPFCNIHVDNNFLMLLHFFYKQLGSGISHQSCLYFYLFLYSCLMIAQQFDQVTYFCQEYSNFQDSKSIFMMSNFSIFPIMLLGPLNFVYCWANSYFPFITKEKLHFSLIYSFCCCLVEEVRALEIGKQFSI